MLSCLFIILWHVIIEFFIKNPWFSPAVKLLLSGCELKIWYFSESFSACSPCSLPISQSNFILNSVGINKTASAFTSVLCLEKLWAVLEMDSEVFAGEGSSRRALEGPEYVLRSLGSGLSVGGSWSTAYPPLSGPWLLTGGVCWGGTLGSQATADRRDWKLCFSFLELLWDNTGQCELKSLIKISSA